MIFVVVEELIPDSQSGNNTDLNTKSNDWLYNYDDFRCSTWIILAIIIDIKLIMNSILFY